MYSLAVESNHRQCGVWNSYCDNGAVGYFGRGNFGGSLFCCVLWLNNAFYGTSEEVDRKSPPIITIHIVTVWQLGRIVAFFWILFQIWIDLDLSRFVRRDRSSPVKNNVQIFLSYRTWLNQIFSDALEQFRFDWEHATLRNAERFARIDLDLKKNTVKKNTTNVIAKSMLID